jgi:type I restriction enzyme, S subunit
VKLPAYSELKPSGIQWLGNLPSHWEPIPLKYVTRFVNGMAFKPDEWTHDGVPIIRIENLNGGEEFNGFEGEVLERYHVNKGDLLFGWSGNRGTSFGPFDWPREGLHYLNQHIFRLAEYECDKRWLYWTLNALTKTIEDEAHGIIGMVHITKGDLGALKIPRILLPEQQQIAAFLDWKTGQIDALIARKQELLEKLKEKRLAVITQAVNRGLNPAAPLRDSGIPWLGLVPAHWEILRLKWAVMLQRGHDLPADERVDGIVPIVSSSGISGFHDTAVAKAPGIVTGRYGTIGVFHLIEEDYWPLNTTLYGNDLNGNEPRFLRALLESIAPLFVLNSKKSAVPGVDRNDVLSIPVALPELGEQKLIADHIDAESRKIDEMCAKTEEAIDRLAEYRTALITAATTGKIDVRGVKIPHPTT